MSVNADRRIQTLLAIVVASRKLPPVSASAIIDEFAEFLKCTRIEPTRRKRLLKILHAVRGMETAAKEVVMFHGLMATKRSLGGYLTTLANSPPPRLPQNPQLTCQATVVKLRNEIMHAAGAYPRDDNQLDNSVTHIVTCLSTLLR
jgi:hypothetical protein